MSRTPTPPSPRLYNGNVAGISAGPQVKRRLEHQQADSKSRNCGYRVSAWASWGCTSLGVPEPGRDEVQTLPQGQGVGNSTPSLLGDAPALPEQVGCGKVAIPGRAPGICRNFGAHSGWRDEAGAKSRQSAPGLVPEGHPGHAGSLSQSQRESR